MDSIIAVYVMIDVFMGMGYNDLKILMCKKGEMQYAKENFSTTFHDRSYFGWGNRLSEGVARTTKTATRGTGSIHRSK